MIITSPSLLDKDLGTGQKPKPKQAAILHNIFNNLAAAINEDLEKNPNWTVHLIHENEGKCVVIYNTNQPIDALANSSTINESDLIKIPNGLYISLGFDGTDSPYKQCEGCSFYENHIKNKGELSYSIGQSEISLNTETNKIVVGWAGVTITGPTQINGTTQIGTAEANKNLTVKGNITANNLYGTITPKQSTLENFISVYSAFVEPSTLSITCLMTISGGLFRTRVIAAKNSNNIITIYYINSLGEISYDSGGTSDYTFDTWTRYYL